jgi:nicotinamide mononucleotide transporter
VTPIELAGAAAGLACVWLAARASVWNWPVSIVNTLLYTVVFTRAKLYGDALLQVVFTVLQLYGWWSWLRPGERGGLRAVRFASFRERMLAGAAALGGTALAATVLRHGTDSPVPIWDASVLVLSLVAITFQARKLVESWWLWILVDLISVPLYVSRELYPTAALYTLFLAICVYGLRGWLRLAREAPA